MDQRRSECSLCEGLQPAALGGQRRYRGISEDYTLSGPFWAPGVRRYVRSSGRACCLSGRGLSTLRRCDGGRFILQTAYRVQSSDLGGLKKAQVDRVASFQNAVGAHVEAQALPRHETG